MTLRELASAIRNNIVNGLKGTSNEAFSIEQLMKEIILEANTVITLKIAEKVLSIESVAQRIDGIEIECTDISANCAIDSQVNAPHIEIPKLSQFASAEESLLYIGPMDNSKGFKVYTNRDYVFHEHNLATKNRPYVWVNVAVNTNGMYDVFFFNLGKYNNLKYVSVTARFENVYDLLSTSYADQFTASEFYAPALVQNIVMTNITQKWVNYYRQLATPPPINNQE